MAVPDLIKALEEKRPPDSITGLIYKINNTVHTNEPAIVEDIDSLPWPAYHLLPMRRYNSIISDYPVSTMISSRGCPYQCRFCFKQPSDIKFRMRSARNVVDEMAYLVEKYRVKEIMFYDDVMTLHRPHIAGICEEILSRALKVTWEAPSRIDTVDRDLLRLMRKAGCIRLRYGIESGDEAILELMHKKIDLGRAIETFKLTREEGIGTFAYFMIGYAHETEATVKKTIDLALKIDPDLVMFTAVTPYPMTPLYEEARSEGLVQGDYWREFTLGNVRSKRIPYFFPSTDRWIKKAYVRFYFRPAYILKRLTQIRSWQDVVKSIRAFYGIVGMR
jgi:radical SAM superfamily enzyme YgiQ (UPF0313 family)